MKLFLVIAVSAAVLAGGADAKTKRSSVERCAFLKSQGYSGCHTPKGYIVDHVKPLCKGGPDKRSNMQLQTKADAKAKDRTECK